MLRAWPLEINRIRWRQPRWAQPVSVEEMAEEIAALVAAHNTSSLSDEEDFRGVHTMSEKRTNGLVSEQVAPGTMAQE